MAKNKYRAYNYKIKTKQPKLTKEQKRAIWLENRDKISLNQIIKPILFLFLALGIEILNYYLLNIRSSSGSRQLIPTYFFFDLGIWLIIAGIMLTCTRTWLSNTLFYTFTLLHIAICVVNASLYKDFGYLFTWDMFVLAMEALDSFEVGFIDFSSLAIYLVILIVFIALPLVIDKFTHKKMFKLTKLSRPIILLICFLTCFTLGTTSYGVQAATLSRGTKSEFEEIENDKYLYSNMHITEEAFRKFGTCGFYIKNFYDLTLGKLFITGKNEYTKSIKSQVVSENESALLHDENLIVIMLESYEWFAIDPYNTPNLWKLKTGTISSEVTSAVPSKGVVMHNYVSNNKTNVSEDAALLGYMPHINQIKLGKNTLATSYSLPNAFKKQGYTANYFHNFLPNFYDRNIVNENIGFDKFYSTENFKSDDGKSSDFNNFYREADFASQLINKIAPTDKKFMSFYTTVSSHGPYNQENSRFKSYYKTYDENLTQFKSWLSENGYQYPTSSEDAKLLRQYKSSAIDTDVMIGKLFKHLEDNNLLNNTTVMIYADHNAYFHNLTQTIKGTKIEDIGNLKTHTVPFMIYSSKLGSKDVYDFCNTFDIYPTICELFGLEYSKFFTLGYNMLSTDIENSIYVSHLTGHYDSKCYSKTMKNITLLENSTSDDAYDFKLKVCNYYEKANKIEKVYRAGWKTS